MRIGRDIAPKIFLNESQALSTDPYSLWQNIYNRNDKNNKEDNNKSIKPSQPDSNSDYNEKGDYLSDSDENEERSVSSLSSTNNKLDEAVLKLLNLKQYDIFSYARHNRFKELETLFIQGLNPDSKDEYGNTILTIAAQNDNKRIVKLALRYGSRINMPNSMGNTALHFAAEYNYNTVYEYLIQKGADPEQKNLRGIRAKEGFKKPVINPKNLFLGNKLNNNTNNVKMNRLIKKIV